MAGVRQTAWTMCSAWPATIGWSRRSCRLDHRDDRKHPHRQDSALLQGLQLRHAQHLEPGTPGHRQAEVTGGETNPRFIVTSLKRSGEQARGSSTKTSTAHAATWRTASRSPARPVRRPDVHRDHASQPAPPVVRLDGLRVAPAPCVASGWPTQFAEATCGTDSPQAAEDRCPGPRQRRQIKIAMASAYLGKDAFGLAHAPAAQRYRLIRTRHCPDAYCSPTPPGSRWRANCRNARHRELQMQSRLDIRSGVGIYAARLLVSMRNAG